MGWAARKGRLFGVESGQFDCKCRVTLPRKLGSVTPHSGTPFLTPRPAAGLCQPSPAELGSGT